MDVSIKLKLVSIRQADVNVTERIQMFFAEQPPETWQYPNHSHTYQFIPFHLNMLIPLKEYQYQGQGP